MIVNDAQDAEPAAVGEAVADKIKRPAFIGTGRHHKRRPCAQGTLATAALPDLKTFFPVQPPELLVVQVKPLPLQQDMQPPVTETPALMAQLFQPLP